MSEIGFKKILNDYQADQPRTRQSREGRLGPSDIGFCRNKAVLVSRETKPTDEVNNWPAAVGTAMHDYIESACEGRGWILGSKDKRRVSATLPSGAEIAGTPDIIMPKENQIVDIKTVNGFEWIRRNGPNTSHLYQRHLYALGAMQEGLLEEDGLTVANAYFDRSGSNQDVVWFEEPFDPNLTLEIDSWVEDVIYAVRHGEDSSKDVAAPVCERICEFFTVCRGGLDDSHSDGMITDTDLLSHIDLYVEGGKLEAEGRKMKSAAKPFLGGVSGMTSTHQVRWVTVNPSRVEAYERDSYERLDVRKRRV